MPVFFIHGVNVRNTDAGYAIGLAARNELLQRMVLQPLAAQDARFRQMEIVSPYWGDFGVRFHWNMASLPAQFLTEGLEAVGDPALQADQITAETIAAIAHAPLPVAAGNGTEALMPESAAGGPIIQAAQRDLLRLLESLLTPLLLAETRLLATSEDAETEGEVQARLAIAAYEVANDPAVQAQVRHAQTDAAVIELLTRAVQARFTTQFVAEAEGDSDGASEALLPEWLGAAREQIGSLFGRVLSGPVGAIATTMLDTQRAPLHRNLGRFLGDIFVYLVARGEVGTPGPIVAGVLDALRNTPTHHLDEPVIVITHSMGGNILYDLITHYAPDVRVDVWISVGGQVGQFEEMKLFRNSDPAVAAPHKAQRPGVGYWLNVYDPADILSFRVSPIFSGVDADEAFDTGASVLKAHGEYFGRAGFYALVRKHIERAL